MTAPDFRRIRNGDDLATFLPCAAELVASRIAGDKSSFVHHAIPKRNPHRGVRDVWACSSEILLQALTSFGERFDAFARAYVPGFPHSAAHGYLKDRSILTNATPHVGSKRLLHADIKDFFPSITTERLARFLVSIGMTGDGARAVSLFATLEGRLPLGFPSSPVLANALCLDLDRDLEALAVKHGARYTRYADDLTFSSKGSSLPSAEEVSEAVIDNEFELAEEKTSVKKRGQAYYVTGLSVSEKDQPDKDRPRAPAKLKHRLRQELHYIETEGLYEHLGARGYPSYRTGINFIGGALRFLHSIEPDLAKGMRDRWREELKKAGASESYESRAALGTQSISLFFDESVVTVGRRRILLLGAVAVEDVAIVRQVIVRFLGDKQADPFNAGDQANLDVQGLHWAELHPDLRTELVGLLARLPFRAYVAHVDVPDDKDYTQRYLDLLVAMLSRRFVALDGQAVTLCFEENPRVSRNDIAKAVGAVDQRIKQMGADSKGPSSVTIEIKGKLDEPCLALADGMLAVFGEYAKKPPSKDPSKKEQHDQRYERLRTKIRVVQSLDDGKVYTRRSTLPRW